MAKREEEVKRKSTTDRMQKGRQRNLGKGTIKKTGGIRSMVVKMGEEESSLGNLLEAKNNIWYSLT